MNEIGSGVLAIAFVAAALTAWAAYAGGRWRNEAFIETAERGAVILFSLMSVAMAALLMAFLRHDFSVKYVAEYSSTSMPMFYTVSALWAGQSGSLLLWGWLLSLFGMLVMFQNRQKNREVFPYVLGTISTVSFFFLILMVFATNPFERLPVPPPDGRGLNPLLQNPGMVFHPPTLYLGYVGFTVPFAFAVAALLTRKLDAQWIRSTRRWTLFSWLFLTLGNLFGAQWAYVELGWGGYWAWDPVENASFMPWLTGTAFLHSVMIQEKKGMLKVWNMVLIFATFALTIFGTFITRSGIISSVHSFGMSNLGPLFLGFLAVILVVSLSLLVSRWRDLRSENELDSFVSRESSFLFNNLILVGMAFAVLWGTLFPIISEAVRGVKITVGPPFFNQINVPIGLALLLLTGICPLIAWRKASARNLRRNFSIPATVGILGGGALFFLGVRKAAPLLSFTFSLFVLVTIALEFYRGTRARARISGDSVALAFWNLIVRNKRRYGGYIVHLGVIMIFVGITGSTAFKQEAAATLKPGESMTVGAYTLSYQGLSEYPTRSHYVVAANLWVEKNGRRLEMLTPEKNFYKGHQPSTEVAIRSTLKEDLYVILNSYDKSKTATFKVFINPLVKWIWVGGGVMVLGTFICLGPDRPRRRAPVRQRREREKARPGEVVVES